MTPYEQGRADCAEHIDGGSSLDLLPTKRGGVAELALMFQMGRCAERQHGYDDADVTEFLRGVTEEVRDRRARQV